MTAIDKSRKRGRPNSNKLFRRNANSKQWSITIPIPYGEDCNGNITDDLNEIKVIQKPMHGKGLNVTVEVEALSNEDAYYKFCGTELPTEEQKREFMIRYPHRAEKLRLHIVTSDGIIAFDDSEFIGKTAPELMRLMGRKYSLDFQMQVRIEKIRKAMIANGMERYDPEGFDGKEKQAIV